MKTLWLFLMVLSLGTAAGAQDSWKVVHNRKQQLQATEDAVKNTILISKADLEKKGSLCVKYKEEKPAKDWKRTIALFDEKDAELLQQEGRLLKISNAQLRSLIDKTPVIKVYTWALPTDPNVAATVRVRRVHLCTIQVKDEGAKTE
jgi:hypothetical protein